MNSHIIHTSKGRIEYSIRGEGIPVLFIHGGHSNCNETLSHKGFDLGKYQLITPSRPAYGNTPLNKENESPSGAAELIIELLNELNIEECILYGISAGGPTSIEMAAQYPDRVSHLILASAVTKKWLSKKSFTYQSAQFLFHPAVEKYIWGMIRLFTNISPQLIALSFQRQFSKKHTGFLPDNEVDELISALKKYRSRRGFLNDLEHKINSDKLNQITCPTLILHSQYDKSVSIDHAHHAGEHIENAQVVKLLNKWGHMIWIEKKSSKIVSKSIQDFLRKHN